jgi:hypothetical protein
VGGPTWPPPRARVDTVQNRPESLTRKSSISLSASTAASHAAFRNRFSRLATRTATSPGRWSCPLLGSPYPATVGIMRHEVHSTLAALLDDLEVPVRLGVTIESVSQNATSADVLDEMRTQRDALGRHTRMLGTTALPARSGRTAQKISGGQGEADELTARGDIDEERAPVEALI